MFLLGGGARPIHRLVVRKGFQLANHRSALGRNVAALEASQWWSPETLRVYQWAKLRRLVSHAFDRSPFYRRAMEGLGMVPADLRSPEDFARLPVVDKRTINEHREAMVAQRFPRARLIKTASGGSTGAPVSLYHDPDFVAAYRAVKLRNFRWAGWTPGDAWARLWGAQFDVAAHQQLKQRLWDGLTRVMVLPCWDMSEPTMADYAERLRRFRPDVIEAYVTPLYHFARFLEARQLTGIKPRGVICSAEMLFDHQRALIERVFGCQVFNRYGGREAGDIAHECPAGTMHINAENYYVEFLRDGRPVASGEPGEIVVTPLDLYGMPLLRYRVEDVGSPGTGQCACGRGLPAMAMVEGRVQDLISLPGGRFLPGEFFPHLFKDFAIRQFQVEQDRPDHAILRLVREEALTDGDLTYLSQKIRDHTAGLLEITVEFCESIPLTPTGKFRYTISRVPPSLTPAKEVASA